MPRVSCTTATFSSAAGVPTRSMDHLVRNSDGDELLFIHDGEGELFCDWGRLVYRDGDYIVLPRGAMWRIEPTAPTTMLLIEATEGSYQLPEKGLLGPQAIFDPAILDTPRMDEAFRAQQGETPTRRRGEAAGKARHHHLPVQPAGRDRLARRPGRRCG